MYTLIKEVLTADPKAERGYFSENRIPVSKPILVGMVEGKAVGDKASTITITDGGREVIQITAFGEDMPMVESRERGEWILVLGVLRYDKRKRVFYIIPNAIEPIPQQRLADFTRFWFLTVAYLRMLAGEKMPEDPCKKVLAGERIPIEEVGDGWIKVKAVQPPAPRRVSRPKKEGGDVRKRVLAFFKERGGQVPYVDYLAWASEEKIKSSVAESVLVELTNDGLVGDSEDHTVLRLTGEV